MTRCISLPKRELLFGNKHSIKKTLGFVRAPFLCACLNFDLSRTMFAPHPPVVLSTFSKVVPHAQWRPRGVSALGVSFVSFSLRLHRQRKAAKEAWYSKIVPQTIAIAYLSSTFSLGQEPQRKSSQKEMPIRLRGGRCCAQGTTFEKVDETIDWYGANTPTNPNLSHEINIAHLGFMCYNISTMIYERRFCYDSLRKLCIF